MKVLSSLRSSLMVLIRDQRNLGLYQWIDWKWSTTEDMLMTTSYSEKNIMYVVLDLDLILTSSLQDLIAQMLFWYSAC